MKQVLFLTIMPDIEPYSTILYESELDLEIKAYCVLLKLIILKLNYLVEVDFNELFAILLKITDKTIKYYNKLWIVLRHTSQKIIAEQFEKEQISHNDQPKKYIQTFIFYNPLRK